MELNREQLIERLMRNDSCYAEDIKAINEAIALIRYDEEKIKELTEVVKQSETAGGCEESVNNGFSPSVTELQRENERLSQSLANISQSLANSKADTVRKMQKMIKAEKFHHKNFGDLVYLADIDRIAKEMLEDGNG